MLRTENGKLVIEMETGDAAFETCSLMHDIVLCNGCDRQGICEQWHGLHIFAVPAVGGDAAERGRYEDYLRGEGQEVKRKGRKK